MPVSVQTAANHRQKRTRAFAGFTLVELLVVIAIVGILASLMLPSLFRAKQRALGVACINNLKQLQLGIQIYASDHDDALPPNHFVSPGVSHVSPHRAWCEGNARTDATPQNIKKGVLYPYVNDESVYHCPSDRSVAESETGYPLTQLRARSYSMSGAINCRNTKGFIPQYEKLSEIVIPSPSKFMVFLDVHEDSILDGHFQIFPRGLLSQGIWGDLPSDRHFQGCNLAFADGHAERWEWKAPKRFLQYGQATQSVEDEQDLEKLQGVVKPLDGLY